MLFGPAEETDEDLEAAVNDVFIQLGEKPRCDDVIRLGKTASTGGSKTARPVKVTLPSSAHVSAVLSKASRLKGCLSALTDLLTSESYRGNSY